MVDIRKVVYHPKHGVLLNAVESRLVWSRDHKDLDVRKMTASTFLSEKEAADWLADRTCGDWFAIPGAELREVWPSNGIEATSEDCGTAGLGYWHE